MDFEPTAEQRELRERVLAFARERLNDDIERRDREHVFSRELWQRCGELGLQGLPVDERHGGVGLDPLSTAIALEALGQGCRDGGLVFSVCAHLLACVVPIWRHGSDELKARLLPALCSGERIAVNAMTEPGTGSDAFAMSTRARPEPGGGYRLNGTKTFCSNGPVADLAVVYSATSEDAGYHGGITAFAVERAAEGRPDSGFQVGQRFQKMGLHTAPLCELVFDDVLVAEADVIGESGSGGTIFNESMEWERTLIPAAHVGTMQRLLDQCVTYARTRKQYGKAIGKYQAVSGRLVDMKVRLETARLLTRRTATRLGRRDVGQDASMTKLYVSEALVESALDAVRTLGGYGYMQEYEVERALRDAVGGVLYSGTSDVQRNVVAAWLGL
jgi:alkylation response protein AidB-like acyl-CoA dehydrogenase